MAFTTADDLVERALDIIEALTPDMIPGSRFRRYRGEGDGDFVTWAEASPESAFRRVQARHNGSVRVPDVSNGDFEERETTITVLIAYPNDGRAGKNQTRSRDQLIGLDLDQLERAIGLYSRANFQSPNPEAFFRDWSSARIAQDACTFLSVEVTYAFYRALTNLTALTATLADSTDPLTANGGAFSYTLDINNTGIIPAENIVATVTLPTGVGYTSASGTGWTCTNNGQTVTCRRESGDTGAMPTITIGCTAPSDVGAGSMTASVSVSATNVETAATDSEDTTLLAPTNLVVLFGQSNAAGRAAAADVTIRSGYTDPYAGITLKHRQDLTTDDPLIWQNYPTETLRPRTDSATENFGPELSMGRLLDAVAPGEFAIVQTAIGGAGLNDHLKKTAVYPSTGDNAYKQTVDYIKEAETTLGPVAAFVWVQGETDALVEAADAAAYQANLTQFIADMRSEKAAWASVPFVFNKLNINNVGSWRDDVRAAQVAVAVADATTKLLVTDDLALNGGQHFFADGYVLVGERLGYGVLEMLDYSQDVRVDATSLIKRPANRLQWRKLIADNNLNWGLPRDSVSLQDLSGNIVGVHGNVRLVPANAPLYDQAIPGWSAHGAGTAEASTSKFRDGTGNLPNCNTTSWLVYAIIYLPTNPAAQRCILGLGTGTGLISVRALPGVAHAKLRISAGSNVDGTVEYSTAFPLVLKLDRTGLITAVYTNKEKLLPTVGSPSGTELDLGSASPSTAPDMVCPDLTLWTGTDAEKSDADIKAMLQANGWTVTGY